MVRDDELIGDERLVETDEEEFELDPLDSEELETAMREALEAVESSAEQSRATDGDDPGVSSSPADTIALEDDEVAQLQAEIADLRDRSVRTLADFDNYRKRIERERHEERRYVAFDVLREFLSVIDNLERALESEGSADDLKTGVDLIVRQMQDLLRAHGVARIEADGELFDPTLHDAVSRHEDPEVEAPTVSEELQTGYKMYDRLLRPAIVKVAMPAEDSGDKGPETSTEEDSTD